MQRDAAQFDVNIQKELTIEPWDDLPTAAMVGGAASGRGGTDLRAPFVRISSDPAGRYAQVDALIVITDGFGPLPNMPPAHPVLWVITPGGVNSCSFGAELHLPSTG